MSAHHRDIGRPVTPGSFSCVGFTSYFDLSPFSERRSRASRRDVDMGRFSGSSVMKNRSNENWKFARYSDKNFYLLVTLSHPEANLPNLQNILQNKNLHRQLHVYLVLANAKPIVSLSFGQSSTSGVDDSRAQLARRK